MPLNLKVTVPTGAAKLADGFAVVHKGGTTIAEKDAFPKCAPAFAYPICHKWDSNHAA